MISGSARVFAYANPCDMRKQARGLCDLVKAELKKDPRSGDIFFFLNRRKSLLKLLFWDETGVCVLSKQLDRGNFRFAGVARDGEVQVQISSEQLFRIIGGSREP